MNLSAEGNVALSFLILAGFFWFLTMLSIVAVRRFSKGYKLERQNKKYGATEPIFRK